MEKSGSHLSTARRWIQRKFSHGDRVTWGSNDKLGIVFVKDIEDLSQDIKRALLQEYKIKDTDHKYKYCIFSTEGSNAFIGVDTMKELWIALFEATGDIVINNNNHCITLFNGTADEARSWVMENRYKNLDELE